MTQFIRIRSISINTTSYGDSTSTTLACNEADMVLLIIISRHALTILFSWVVLIMLYFKKLKHSLKVVWVNPDYHHPENEYVVMTQRNELTFYVPWIFHLLIYIKDNESWMRLLFWCLIWRLTSMTAYITWHI